LGEEGADRDNQINDDELEDVMTQGATPPRQPREWRRRPSDTSGRGCEAISTQRLQEWMTRYIPM
jgi:hypothetical protein